MDHLIDSNAARQEAYEEAGIGGRVQRVALGHFSYDKRLADGSALPVRADVYGLEVGIEHKSWPEKKQRTRQWFSVEEAAGRVDEPGLKKIIRSLA